MQISRFALMTLFETDLETLLQVVETREVFSKVENYLIYESSLRNFLFHKSFNK